MKTNSTFKFLRNLLLLVVGVMGFAVSGVGATKTISSSSDWASVTENDDVVINLSWNSSVSLTKNIKCKTLSFPNNGGNKIVCGSYSIEVTGSVTMQTQSAEIEGTLTCGSLSMTGSSSKVTGNVNATGSVTMQGQSAKINGDVLITGSLTISGTDGAEITGTARVPGDVTMSGYSSKIATLYLTGQNQTVAGWDNAYNLPEITHLWYCPGSSFSVTKNINIPNSHLREDCGASVSGTPSISANTIVYCDNNRPVLTASGCTVSGGTPQYKWYNSSGGDPITTSVNTWTATAAGTYYVVVCAGDNPCSSPSATITLSAPVGNPTITADNSVSFENTVGCTPLDEESVSATLGNVCAGSIDYTFTGANADKFELSKTPSIAGKVYTYSVRFKENTTPGTYTATLRLTSGGTTKDITLTGTVPTPELTTDKSASTQSLMNENGAAKKSFVVTPTLKNSCATITASSNNAEFSVEDNGNGTFTVTYENNEYDDEDDSNNSASGTITFSAGGATATVNVEGSISSCSASEIATINFNGSTDIPSSIVSPFGTLRTSSCYDAGHGIFSSNYHGNCKAFNGGNDGNVLQTVGDTKTYTAFTLRESTVLSSGYYRVSMKIGNNAPNYNTTTYTVSLGGKSLGTIANNTYGSVSAVFSGAELLSGVNMVIAASSDDKVNSAYFDDIVITKLCPPEVKVSVTNECVAGTMGFSAAASAISGSSISSYQWYKNGVAISGATSATYTPSELFTSGTKITVKVTDDLGLSTTSKPYTYSCGPIISDITAPATICAGGALSISAPSSVTSASAISEQGWEYCATEDGVYTQIADFTSFKSAVAVGYKNYYLRYYAINEKAKSTSNAVQITMFDAPTIGSVTAPSAVCDGSALTDLSVPPIDAKGASINSQGWEISNGGGWSSFNPSTTLTHSGYDGKNIRYFVQNQCSDRTNSSTVPLVVNYPTVELADIPNRNAAVGYVATVATPSLTTNECAGTVTYSLSVSGTDASNFSFNTSTGEVRTTEDLPIGEYTLTITATEDGKNVSDSKTFKVTVVAESPIIMDCSGGSYDDFSQCAIIAPADYSVTSRNLTENVQLSLEGDLADYFSLSRSEIPMNTENQAVRFTQTKTLPIGTNSVKISAKSDGVEFASCLWTFTVPSPFTGSITTPELESTGTNPKCSYEGTGTLSATASLDISSTCDGYPKYGWFKNGELVGSLTSSYSSLNLGTIDGADAGSYTLRVFSGENAYFESPSYTLLYPLQISIAGSASEFYCAEQVPVVATDGFEAYAWYNGTTYVNITEGNTSDIQLKCGSNGDYLAVVTRDNAGCNYTASVPITIRSLTQYYYCGDTGADSDLTEPTNWCTSPSGTAGSCTSPSNFVADGCEYIINKNGVELLEAQEWTVSGNGSKITVGNDTWAGSFTTPSGWDARTNNYGGSAYKNGYIAKTDIVDEFTKLAIIDNRTNAKELKLSGKLTTTGNVSVDVTHGASLTIATDKGDFALGTLAVDDLVYAEIRKDAKGAPNGYDQPYMKLGSSVTYTGDGAKKILQGAYSQLYIEDATSIAFEEDAIVSVAQVLKNNTSVAADDVNPNGSTVQYIGTVHQDVAALKYYNLQTESASTKTLVGNIEVTNSLNIGAGSTLSAGNKNITVSGSGADAVVMIGKFDCGTSTFTYSSASETTVEAMNYYNLNLGNGARTLASHNHIGVAGTFTPGSGSKTITGSTVEFNGSSMQTIPAFTFYNLDLNNTASRANSTSLNSDFYVKQSGNVVIQNNLVLSEGILDTQDHTLSVTNPAASAVGQGYQTDAQHVSFIVGDLTRKLPDNLSNSSAIYYFPVGDGDYKPLMLNQITTSVNPVVTVGIYFGGLTGSLAGGESVNSEFAWKVSGTAGYTSASVGVSDASGLASFNALVYGETSDAATLEDIYGTANAQGTLLYSLPRSSGYYALATREIPTDKIYYYDCNGSDITNKNNWHKSDGTTKPTSFSEVDAKWVIQCGATIDEPLTINGSNSVVEMVIPKGQKLVVNNEVEFISATVKKGTMEVGANGVLTVDHDFKMDDIAAPGGDHQELQLVGDELQLVNTYSNRSSLINNGRVNLYLSKMTLTNSYIENNGYLYTENVDWDLSSGENYKDVPSVIGTNIANDNMAIQHTRFINNSKIEMINANMYVSKDSDEGARVHIRNASNAVWMIDNTNAPGLSYVTFDGTEFAHSDRGYNVAFVDFQCNSSFIVKHADVKFKPKVNIPSAYIGGDIIVEDGNMEIGRVAQGGGHVTLEQTCGNIYLTDTDNSGDGILTCSGTGGYTINVEGTLHAMGISVAPGASGSSFNVKNGGTVYIGNIGAIVPSYTWEFAVNVESGGTLYYCGNRTSEGDGIGVNAGNLYYAGNYYYDSNPIDEHDFTNNTGGKYQAIFASEEQCMRAYMNGVPDPDGRLLPIELTMLYGVCVDDNKVELRWQTASETNNSHFVILRSFDGVHFEEIGIVMGAGTTAEVHNYEYFDTDDNEGIVYYKLRQVDYDGNYTDSKVIAVQTCGKNARFSIGSEEIEVFFRNPQANYVVITSVTGQIFYSKKFTNVEEARIAVPQRKGIYIISVIDSKQITSEKFIR